MYVGFVELPLYKPRCWQKWFSTISELILEGTMYQREPVQMNYADFLKRKKRILHVLHAFERN